MKKEEFNRNIFFDTLIQGSIKALKKGQVALDRLYSGYQTLVENQIKSTPEREQECNELLQILERSYRMFSNPEVENIILKNNVSAKQFISKYGEKLLGNNKRKYDMSDRFNPDLIAYQDKGKQIKGIQYVPKEGREYIYLDSEGKEISIQEIGRLHFKEWNGIGNGVSKYRVMRRFGQDVYQENEIFSNIRIVMMEDPEYREAVLEELLSRNNIQLSKTGGYVGEITELPTSEGMKTGSEKVVAGDYFYKVSPRYALTYHSEDIAAAMIFDAAQKTSKGNLENGKIIQMADRRKMGQNVGEHNTSTTNERKVEGESR